MAYFDVDKRKAGIMFETSVSGSMHASPGEKAAGEYIVSGRPFVSSSSSGDDDGQIYELKFPRLTNWIQFQNGSGAAKIGFSAGGIADTQYFDIAASVTTQVYEIRTKSLFIDSAGNGWGVIAGLTDILTGSVADNAHSAYWGT